MEICTEVFNYSRKEENDGRSRVVYNLRLRNQRGHGRKGRLGMVARRFGDLLH